MRQMAGLDILASLYSFSTIKAAMGEKDIMEEHMKPTASIQIQYIQKARNHAARHSGSTVMGYGKIRCRIYPNH